MTLQLRQLVDALSSHARSVVALEGLTAYEPAGAPGGKGLSLAVFLHSIKPVRGGHGLDSTTLRVEMWVRLYYPSGTHNDFQGELAMAAAVDALGEAVSGDFTLSGTVMHVDLLGQYGDGVGGTAGYTAIDGAEYRVFTLAVPLILSDMWPQSP